MLLRLIQIFIIFSLFALSVLAQGAEDRSPYSRGGSEELSKFAKESRDKMRIEKEKKDHDAMLERGEEVRKLSEQLEKSFEQNGRLSDKDLAALESVERNVKKIRNELGGDDDDEKLDDMLASRKNFSVSDAVSTFKSQAASLVDEIKKTTRFTISATAIQTSNTVIKLARFLRIRK